MEFQQPDSTQQEHGPMQNRTYLLAVASVALLALTAFQSLAQSTYTPYAITTLAGMAGSPGSVDGTGSEARFLAPGGVAVDNAGNVYVADFLDNTLRKVTSTGVVTTLAGSSQDTNGDGNPDGGYADGVGIAARFYNPTGIAVDLAGNVYVADSGNQTIRKVTAAGVVTTLAGLGGSSGSVDGVGIAARFDNPTGVAVDLAGNVYVADYGDNTIRKVTAAGVVTTLAGKAGSIGSADGTGTAARFGTADGGPLSVAVDSVGNVYVADKFNNTIRRVTKAGVVTTLAGLARIEGSADGTGSAARFSSPLGIAVDSAGNLYVADGGNATIRKGHPENVPAVIVTSGSVFGFNGGPFRFNLTGPTGQLVVVEASPDLVNWLPLLTNTFAGTFTFSDPQSGGFPLRYYRARTP